MCEAVIAEPADVPKLMPFALEKDSVEKAYDPFAALTATGCVDCWVSPLCDAVIVEPFRPNETPLELEKTTLPRLPEVVPAEKLTG